MLTLINNTKATAKVGYIVALDPTNPQAFIYATPNSVKAIGVVGEASAYRKPTKIFTIGDKAQVYVQSNVVSGDVIRLSKSGDNISLGAGIVAKASDAPYLKIGDALNSGRGLISVVLMFSYNTSGSTPTIDHGLLTGLSDNDHPQYALAINALGEEFETVSKNLKSYPYVLTYGVDGIDTIVYNLGGGLSITKTFNYTLGILTSIVLSGDTPLGIELTKTLIYTGVDLTSVTYS
ncbi:MAG: hypothetical protein BWY21_01465 [Parcubacteria group bacterium ADurb.Bin216]|nr:MAG: hypothetical protein BWY21_01465 [Parcubacteria group bacterium ADurb.Bin216]